MPEDIEKAVRSDTNHAFSKSATRDDDSLDYVATQILVEGFQNVIGLAVVAYKSSYGEKGSNVVFFDISGADLNQLLVCIG